MSRLRRILKYSLSLDSADEPLVLLLPMWSKFLCAGDQAGTLVVWYEVPQGEQPCIRHELRIHGTGHLIEGEQGEYRATVQMGYGLVWHIYENRQPI